MPRELPPVCCSTLHEVLSRHDIARRQYCDIEKDVSPKTQEVMRVDLLLRLATDTDTAL